MLVHLFTIISLLIFLVTMLLGSSFEPAIIKSSMVFITLVVGTRIGSFIVNIIGAKKTEEEQVEERPDPNLKQAA
jgi:uncharacterized Tic20 family protein